MPTTKTKPADKTIEKTVKATIAPSDVKVGHILCVSHFVKVKDVTRGGGMLQVDMLDSTGDFQIKGSELVADCKAADQFAEEETVTMTRAAEILVASYNVPLTVCFIKQGTDKNIFTRMGEMLKLVKNAITGGNLKDLLQCGEKVEKLLEDMKKAEAGEERTLRGRLIAPEPLLGRSLVDDLDIDRAQNRQRRVDHRTIKWLIVGNVKYTVK